MKVVISTPAQRALAHYLSLQNALAVEELATRDDPEPPEENKDYYYEE